MLCVYTSCICPTRMRDWVYNVHSISVGMHFLTEQLLYMKTCLVCLCVWCVYHFWLLSSCASWVLAPRNSTICPLCLYTAILLCKLSLGRHGLVLLGSFPGSPTPEHEHWSYAGGENKRSVHSTAACRMLAKKHYLHYKLEVLSMEAKVPLCFCLLIGCCPWKVQLTTLEIISPVPFWDLLGMRLQVFICIPAGMSTLPFSLLLLSSTDNSDTSQEVRALCSWVWSATVGPWVPFPHQELCQGRDHHQDDIGGVQELSLSHTGWWG